jgi:glycerate kinase
MAASPAPFTLVVAPDKFKGSLRAAEAAAAIAAGARAAATRLGVTLRVRASPVTDGGDGQVEAAVAAGFTAHERSVAGPTGERVDARFAVGTDPADGRSLAVVELASASGLAVLPGSRPTPATARTASTRGTGELVAAALDLGVQRLLLGLGGSAGPDGGAGLAAALGARFLDAAGRDLAPGGAALRDLDRVDLSALDARLSSVEVVVACDVDSPMNGPTGAAAVYGPQKGARPDDVAALDEGLRRLARVLHRDTGDDVERLPGAGAAGGTGGGAVALLGARLVPGAEAVLGLVGFDRALAGAHLVVTGEGSLDAQSLAGKAPLGVARAAAARGVPVLFLAGRVDLDEDATAALHSLGAVGLHALTDLEPDLPVARRDASVLLRTLAARTVGPLLGGPAAAPTLPRPSTPTTARSPA